ncbi:MAG: hypothetical protein EWM72_01025 [Nitrospira sp.]|nr:MAG: hypothetical protein EWM72_01025 [Nitrospira sp.]
MRKTILFSVVSVLLWVLMAQGVQADEKKGGMCPMCKMHEQMESAQADPGHYVHHLLMHAKELGLKADQIAKLKALRLDLERTRLKTDAEIRIADLELDALVEDEQADFSAIEAKVQHKETLEAGLELATIKAKREALALLTPDQREKEKAVREKMMERMMGGMMERMHPKTNEAAPGSKDEHQH